MIASAPAINSSHADVQARPAGFVNAAGSSSRTALELRQGARTGRVDEPELKVVDMKDHRRLALVLDQARQEQRRESGFAGVDEVSLDAGDEPLGVLDELGELRPPEGPDRDVGVADRLPELRAKKRRAGDLDLVLAPQEIRQRERRARTVVGEIPGDHDDP